MMDIDNQNQYFKGGSIMAYDFRDSNGKWTGSSNERGYCSDVYGNYTGRISSDGSFTDRYGNYVGSVDISTGKFYDRFGYETGDKNDLMIVYGFCVAGKSAAQKLIKSNW